MRLPSCFNRLSRSPVRTVLCRQQADSTGWPILVPLKNHDSRSAFGVGAFQHPLVRGPQSSRSSPLSMPCMRKNIPLAVNLKFILEGEEEAGSAIFQKALQLHKNLLDAKPPDHG